MARNTASCAGDEQHVVSSRSGVITVGSAALQTTSTDMRSRFFAITKAARRSICSITCDMAQRIPSPAQDTFRGLMSQLKLGVLHRAVIGLADVGKHHLWMQDLHALRAARIAL